MVVVLGLMSLHSSERNRHLSNVSLITVTSVLRPLKEITCAMWFHMGRIYPLRELRKVSLRK